MLKISYQLELMIKLIYIYIYKSNFALPN